MTSIVKIDAPKPRGPSTFDTPPDATWVALRLISALRIDRSYHAATRVGIAELRDIAACAVLLAGALQHVRDLTGDTAVHDFIHELLGAPTQEKPNDQA